MSESSIKVRSQDSETCLAQCMAFCLIGGHGQWQCGTASHVLWYCWLSPSPCIPPRQGWEQEGHGAPGGHCAASRAGEALISTVQLPASQTSPGAFPSSGFESKQRTPSLKQRMYFFFSSSITSFKTVSEMGAFPLFSLKNAHIFSLYHFFQADLEIKTFETANSLPSVVPGTSSQMLGHHGGPISSAALQCFGAALLA